MPYTHLFSAVTDNIQSIIVHGGYPFLFFTVLFEGVPILGTIVPGHVTIIAGGFLAKIGVFSLGWVLLLTITAALMGDCIGFFLGRKYGLSLIDRLRLGKLIRPTHIERAQKLLSSHTGKAMILGRLSPVTRALMPFLVGASETPVHRFWVFNVVGGLIWVLSSVFLGYVFGASYHAAAGYFGKVIVFAVLFTILIAWGYRFVNSRFEVFRRFELFVLGLNLFSLWVVAEMIQDSWSNPPFMAGFDISVNAFMAAHATRALVGAADFLSAVGGATSLTTVGVGLSLWFAFRKKWRSSAIVLASLGSAFVLCGFMKEFFLRLRPDNALVHLTDPSFPSGHATMIAALAVAVAYLFAPKIKGWVVRESFIVICAVVAMAVGLSRIVLNVHWASDVIAGWALGALCATSCILLVRYIGSLIVVRK